MLEHVLTDLAAVFALCVFAGVVFQRFKLPPIVGFLVIGAVLGPNALGLVGGEETVKSLAEVGVVVLLFAVGMELPLSQLARLRRTILIGGGMQIVGTVLVAAFACWTFGMGWNEALFLGFLLALSSTAALTKVLVDHGEFSTPHGRFAMGIAIAQDLAVVPMILLIPMLVGEGQQGGGVLATLENLAILAIVLAVAHLVVPRLLRVVSRTRSRELFVLTLAALCLAMAVVTSHLGMSMALGAFLAGILLADSEFHGHAMAEVEPFRDALASLFFVSIGMLFDPAAVVARPWSVLGALLLVVAGKTAVVMLAARALGQPGWVGVRSGLLLAQVGEFSFVLAQVGGGTSVLPEASYKVFLAVAVASIAATPLMHQLGRWLVARGRSRGRDALPTGADEGLAGHAIVVGYGPTGRTVVQTLQSLGLSVVALETNAATVKQEKQKGVAIEVGDATRASVLKRVGLERARVLVLAVNDATAAQRIAQVASQVAPQVHVLARSVYIGEVQALLDAGADDVVPQELEASVEILVRVLRRFLVADDEIGRRVGEVRRAAGGLGKQAAVARLEAARVAEFLPGLGIAVHRVGEGASAAGRTLLEVGLRKATGCTIVAVRRGDETLPAITPETVLQPGDAVVVLGQESRLADAAAMLVAPVRGSVSELAPTAAAGPRT